MTTIHVNTASPGEITALFDANGGDVAAATDDPSSPCASPRSTWRSRMDEKEAIRADQIIAAFARLWPKCFFVAPEERKPLMLHIHVQLHKHLQPMIEARRISERDIQIALARYTSCDSYRDRIARC